MMKRNEQKKQEAQGMVEFAIVMPVLLLIIFGIFAFGHLFFVYIINVSASREAVRYGIATGNSVNGLPRYADCTEITGSAMRIGQVIGMEMADVVVDYDLGPGTPIFYTCPNSPIPAFQMGARINVTVTTNYDPFIPFVDLPAIPITSFSSRTIVKDIYLEEDWAE